MVKTINVADLKEKLNNQEVSLIDVRELVEYRAEYIEEASLIPLAEISQEKLLTTSKPIVIHCRSGKRSEDACKKLLIQNPTLDLYNLEGGIMAWKAAGYPVKNETPRT